MGYVAHPRLVQGEQTGDAALSGCGCSTRQDAPTAATWTDGAAAQVGQHLPRTNLSLLKLCLGKQKQEKEPGMRSTVIKPHLTCSFTLRVL